MTTSYAPKNTATESTLSLQCCSSIFNEESNKEMKTSEAAKMIDSKKIQEVSGFFSAFKLLGTDQFKHALLNYLEKTYEHYEQHSLQPGYQQAFEKAYKNKLTDADAHQALKDIGYIETTYESAQRYNSLTSSIEKVLIKMLCKAHVDPQAANSDVTFFHNLAVQETSRNNEEDELMIFIPPMMSHYEVADIFWHQIANKYLN